MKHALIMCFLTVQSVYSFVPNSLLRWGFRLATGSKGVRWPRLHKSNYDDMYVNKNITYPEYYLQDFHAYDGGNLNWIAAEECRAASNGVLSFHYEDVSGQDASDIVRGDFMRRVKSYEPGNNLQMVDMACGIGVSSNEILKYFHGNVTGIDLSPYFLHRAINTYSDITFLHENVENTSIDSSSVDIVFISYLFHELPYEITQNVLKEAHRILKYGGIIGILDMDPNIKASNKVSQFIFDRTEPYLEEYKKFAMRKFNIIDSLGFSYISTIDDIPKTTILVAQKTSSAR